MGQTGRAQEVHQAGPSHPRGVQGDWQRNIRRKKYQYPYQKCVSKYNAEFQEKDTTPRSFDVGT